MQLRVGSKLKIYQVVSQELHDESRVLVALLAEGVKFCKYVRSIRYIK